MDGDDQKHEQQRLKAHPDSTEDASPPMPSLKVHDPISLVVGDKDKEPRQEPAKSKKKQDPFIGTVIGERYEILSLVGQGATTSVYKARDTAQERIAAVKILRSEFASSEGAVRRFEQECKTLSLLKHHNIVSFYDNGITDGDQPYLVMEYLDGVSLGQLIAQTGSLDWKRTAQIFIQVCAALTLAHEKGVVHRDLKPANIMVTKDASGNDVIKILDFGVSKLMPFQGETFQTRTQTGEMLGTLLYMSPEQCLDQDLDGRSDIYSSGCVLYEALTGTPPFTARTAFETMNKHLTGMPEKLINVRPELVLPKQLDTIIQKATAIDPKHRYQKISALADDLNKLLSGKGDSVIASVPTPQNTSNKSWLPAALIILFTLAALLSLSLSNFTVTSTGPLFLVLMSIIGIFVSVRYSEKPVPVSKDSVGASGKTHKTLPTNEFVRQTVSDAEPVYSFDIDNFALSVFDRVDRNKDGFITKAELAEILDGDRRGLTSHDATFIQFVLEHHDEFKEIFSDGKPYKGINRDQILLFARSLRDES